MTDGIPQIRVRDKAASRIPEFARKSGGNDNTLLRLRTTSHDDVSFTYTMRFDKSASDTDDMVVVSNGLAIVVDKQSAALLDGTEIAYFDGSARLEQGNNPRKPELDPALGILGTISVHALSPDQLWEPEPSDVQADDSPPYPEGHHYFRDSRYEGRNYVTDEYYGVAGCNTCAHAFGGNYRATDPRAWDQFDEELNGYVKTFRCKLDVVYPGKGLRCPDHSPGTPEPGYHDTRSSSSQPISSERPIEEPLETVQTGRALDTTNSMLAAEVQGFLDPDNGFKCLPRFWKTKLWRMVRRESDELLRRYAGEHLAFLTKYVEPVADDSTPNTIPQFAELCREMAAAPNLAYVAARCGCEEPEEEDSILWLQWAGVNEPEPAKCLYCVAGFVAVPPFAGDSPAIVRATISALASLSLLRLGQPSLAAAVVELFLDIRDDDYASLDSVLVALRRSLLKEIGPPHTTTLRSTLLDSLRAVGRDAHRALLTRAFDEFGIVAF